MSPHPSQIRVALVDDHPVVLDGTATVLSREKDISVVRTGTSLADAMELADDPELDVLLLDVRLAGESGFAAIRQRESGPAILVLTAYDLPPYAAAAARLGAAGFVVKTAPLEDLLAAIRRVAAGGAYFSIRPSGAPLLTERELDVVRLIAEGRSNDEVGAALGITAATVETHLKRVFLRVGVASRTELATRALREGWLELPVANRRTTAGAVSVDRAPSARQLRRPDEPPR